jgi:hypothetical protein
MREAREGKRDFDEIVEQFQVLVVQLAIPADTLDNTAHLTILESLECT